MPWGSALLACEARFDRRVFMVLCDIVSNLEIADQARQFSRLASKMVAGSCGLLDHRCILLCHLIHLVHGSIDLAQSGRLLLSRCSDFRHKHSDVTDLA